MPNSILTPTEITREGLRLLHNNLAFARGADRQYDDKFAKSGAKIGSQLTIRTPNQFEIREGAVMQTQDLAEPSETLTLATQRGVDINFTGAELTLSIDDFSTRYLKPAMARLASEIDSDGLALYKDIYNLVGAAGTTPAAALVWLQAGGKLHDNACPDDGQRSTCMNPAANVATVNGLSGLFQSADRIDKQYKRGLMGQGLGFNHNMDQNVNAHTCGAFAGTVLVDDTVADGDAVITCDAFTDAAPTLKKGDVFTIADVYAVNPETKATLANLQQFTVTADTTGASNEADIPVSPAFILAGAYQTVNALPVDGKAITFVGTASAVYPMNMAYHKEAFALVSADLYLPDGADFAARENMDGISMRIWRDSDIVNDKFPCRIDVLYGWATVRPQLACRVIG